MKKRLPLFIASAILLVAVIITIIYFNNTQNQNYAPIQSEVTCVKAGEFTIETAINPNNNECCKGLDRLLNTPFYSATRSCEEILEKNNGYICTDCGNKICESWENRCNCPLDCESFSNK